MSFTPFRKLNFSDSAVQRFQDNVGQVFDGLSTSFLLNAVLNNGELAQGLVFKNSTDNFVSHKLNRIPKGYFIVSKNGPIDIYTSGTPSPDPEKIIVLVSNADATVNIVFF